VCGYQILIKVLLFYNYSAAATMQYPFQAGKAISGMNENEDWFTLLLSMVHP